MGRIAFKTDIKEKNVCKGIRRSNVEKMKFKIYKKFLKKSN